MAGSSVKLAGEGISDEPRVTDAIAGSKPVCTSLNDRDIPNHGRLVFVVLVGDQLV